ncbi:lactonase family protein [Erysipelothrix amsterdamensis]|uniref:Lactonase family protein n=1 Tax=Erysipelothrix amsterdamensis TaxID=2929157 RepID=A0AAU9VHQ0_9FIRM|nr:lactonase family protein [Erysipelothrix sp. A18Y020d]CAH2761471.1 lactonase family protein [Erysipelothrix sp. A18Y020d]
MTKILLGTYTKSESKGIYEIDLEQDRLVRLTHIAEVENPTYLDYDPTTQTLFSVYQKDDQAGIATWKYQGTNTELIERFVEMGPAPCYVAYDKVEDQIYDANYHKGRVNVYKNHQVFKKIEYKDGSHAHFVNKKPNTEFVYVCDLGLDTVRKYELMNEIATYKAPAGSGPRHLAFHPHLPLLYLFSEHTCHVTVLEDDGFDFIEHGVFDALPETETIRSAAAIRISKDGNYLYVSNRGHDSITVFKISEDGLQLELIQNISSFGEHPRDFALSLDNKYLVCANRDSNNLTLYARDVVNGKLTLLQTDVYAPECVAVLFIS